MSSTFLLMNLPNVFKSLYLMLIKLFVSSAAKNTLKFVPRPNCSIDFYVTALARSYYLNTPNYAINVITKSRFRISPRTWLRLKWPQFDLDLVTKYFITKLFRKTFFLTSMETASLTHVATVGPWISYSEGRQQLGHGILNKKDVNSCAVDLLWWQMSTVGTLNS